MSRTRFFLVVALLVAGAALATLGTPDPDISLSSLSDLWSDSLRDADQVGMRLTRVSDVEEMRIGDEMSRGAASFGAEDAAATAYVTEVAQALLPHIQRGGIHYQFHVVDSPVI